MEKTKTTKSLFLVISMVLAFIINDIIMDYLGIRKEIFSLDFVLSSITFATCFITVHFLIQEMAYIMQKKENF